MPPGWARLLQPGKGPFSGQIDAKGLVLRIEQARCSLPSVPESESVRFRIEDTPHVSTVLWEHDHKETGKILALQPDGPETGFRLWFTFAASALLRRTQIGGGLWGFDIPSHIVNFVRKESIPCGVMVMLGFIAEMDTAPWSVNMSEDANQTNPALRHHRRFLERQRRIREEQAMPPEQARIASMNRQAEERQALHDDMMADARQRTEREEGRLRDAIASTKLSNKAVAEACLAWMIDQEEVQKDTTLQAFAEAVLYLLLVDQRPEGEGVGVVQVLDEWQAWSQHGGMKRSHMAFLGERKIESCCAAALVYMMEEATHTSSYSKEVMKECIRSWKKVRLG